MNKDEIVKMLEKEVVFHEKSPYKGRLNKDYATGFISGLKYVICLLSKIKDEK